MTQQFMGFKADHFAKGGVHIGDTTLEVTRAQARDQRIFHRLAKGQRIGQIRLDALAPAHVATQHHQHRAQGDGQGRHQRGQEVGGERGGGVPTVHAHHQGVARQIQQLLGTENPAAFAQTALHGQARAIGFSERHLLTLHQGRGHHLKQHVVE